MSKKKRKRMSGNLADDGLSGVAPSIAAPPSRTKPKKSSKKAEIAARFSTPDSCRAHTSDWLNGLATDMTAKHGSLTVYTSDKGQELIRGVPLPSLSIEYLYQSTAAVLGGRVTQIVGLEGSCKTGLAIEHGRWFINQGGIVVYREHETKYSPDWIPSTIGWDRQRSWMTMRCKSVDEWQESLLDMAKKTMAMMLGNPPKQPGPGAVFPVLDIVDSVMGSAMAESQDRVIAAGHAGRDHPVAALSITSYMQTYPPFVANWPFHLILINHLKESKDDNGIKVRGKPGGKAKDFQESLEIESTKKDTIQTTKYDGRILRLRTYKNSLGTGGLFIDVPVRWWNEDDPENPGGYRQKTVWDWPESTFRLLTDLLPKEKIGAIKPIIDLKLNKTRGTVSSRRLGISEDAQLSYAEADQVMRADPQLMMELRRALGIKLRKEFTPGMDYREQLLGSKQAAAADYKIEMDARAKRLNKKRR